MQNIRAPEMWRIISQHIDFKDKTVIDLGCGYGDLITYAHDAGAVRVTAVDQDVPRDVRKKLSRLDSSRLSLFAMRLQHINGLIGDRYYDVGFCTSVLPYLDCREELLQWMASHCKQSIIEVQLYGDGPGLPEHTSTGAVQSWLKKYFANVQGIGYTVPEGRSHRAIWLCEGVASE